MHYPLLVIIHAVPEIPESAFWETNKPHMQWLKSSLAQLRTTPTLPSTLLRSDVKGLELIHNAVEEDWLTEIRSGFTHEEDGTIVAHLYRMGSLQSKRDRIAYFRSIKTLLDEAETAPENGGERAIKRCEVLASALPCSFVGCTSFPDPGKEKCQSKTCSGCKVAHYCSGTCQKKDWKVHKIACKAVAAAAAAAAAAAGGRD